MDVSCSSALEKAPLAGELWPTLEPDYLMALELVTSKDCYVTQVDAVPVALVLLQRRVQSSLGGYEKEMQVDDQYKVASKHGGLEPVKVNRISNYSLPLLNPMP